jgi:tellurite resistance protein TerC
MDTLISVFAADWLGKPIWMWTAFILIVLALLAFDLGILHKDDRELGVRESLNLSAFYILFAMAFGGWVWWYMGPQPGIEYFTGYFIEKSLSIDNIFVISLIFSFFAIPRKYQYRALLWGIIAVIVLRGIMIGVGAALVQNFAWVLYIFAAFLIFTGVKMLMGGEEETDLSKNKAIQWLRKVMRVTDEQHGDRFFVKKPDPKTGKVVSFATPLFLALVVINIADLVFAVDSVPAIFAITTDTFVVYTANIMAILGLRALYFALAAMIARFHYLKYALAAVLILIGSKIFIADMLGLAKFPAWLSLTLTLGLIVGGIVYSLWKTRDEAKTHPAQ